MKYNSLYLMNIEETSGAIIAIPDFIIGTVEGFDAAYDWFFPFGLKIDWTNTQIQVMPEAEITTIEMPGMDGSIVTDTVYKDRVFQIAAFSEQGLEQYQKEQLKTNITNILNYTKGREINLTIESTGTTFSAQYEGNASITDGPSYVKAVIPLRVSAYGYKAQDNYIDGNGDILNNGLVPVGTVHRISGPILSPSFTINGLTYSWDSSVRTGETLVVNFDNLTCYIEDADGNKKNALNKLSGNISKGRIPAGRTVTLDSPAYVASQMRTTWRPKVLW